VAIAPCLFDRARRGVELAYSPAEVELGRGYALQVKEEQLLRDMQACCNVVKHAGAVGAVGYCWGGSLAYLAACELPVRCAVSFYGTRTVQLLERKPRVPVQYHFGARDKSIPPESIAKIRAADPTSEFHTYDADHGFSCDHRATYDAAAATLARERSLAFLARHMTTTGDDEHPMDQWADA
jgi:carboxymethylenebutenolidase